MANLKHNEILRLKNILLVDKLATPSRVSDVLKCDIVASLSPYLEVDEATLDIAVNYDDDCYNITISCKGKPLRKI